MTAAYTEQINAATASQAAEPTPVARTGSKTSQRQERGQFGTVCYKDYPGVRFVSTDASPALAEALAAVCRHHGQREGSTAHFLTESNSH